MRPSCFPLHDPAISNSAALPPSNFDIVSRLFGAETRASWNRTEEKRMSKKILVRWFVAAIILVSGFAIVRAQMPNPYGSSVSLENARKLAAPALAEAEKNHWNVAVAIVDTGGNLVYYKKMDNTQLGSANIAIEKARCAALFKRPTKAFQDVLAAGGDGLRVLSLKG